MTIFSSLESKSIGAWYVNGSATGGCCNLSGALGAWKLESVAVTEDNPIGTPQYLKKNQQGVTEGLILLNPWTNIWEVYSYNQGVSTLTYTSHSATNNFSQMQWRTPAGELSDFVFSTPAE